MRNLLIFLLLLATGTAMGQTTGKKRFLLGKVNTEGWVGSSVAEAFRNELKKSVGYRGTVFLVEEVAGVPTDHAALLAWMREKGIAGYVSGRVYDMDTRSYTWETTNILLQREQHSGYKTSLCYVTSYLDAQTGQTTSSVRRTSSERNESYSDSEAKALLNVYVPSAMQESSVQTGKVHMLGDVKGAEARTLFISLGKNANVREKKKFAVFMEVEVAGEHGYKSVGQIEVEQVVSANRSLCKVKKGGKDIKQAFESGLEVIVKPL